MLFNSFVFLQFFAVVYGSYLLLGRLGRRGVRPRKVLLLGASYFFYGYWDPRFLSLIAISTLVDFWCARKIESADSPAGRKGPLWVSVAVNLGILGFFKYHDFFVDSLRPILALVDLTPERLHLGLVLPVGISFYTFQTMSYTIDVYRKEIRASRDLLDFSLYVAFFPQLVAGPIERGKRFLPQIQAAPPVTRRGVTSGLSLVLTGYFKKVVIADNLAPIVGAVFGSGGDVSALEAWTGLYAFALQIYGDFSGYTDIARGLARMMGYDLMLNFRMPYLARTPSGFWSRWHISLSTWLRDYLYIPLGGNRDGRVRTLRNLMITMLLGGLWHGAAWNFVLWGAFHGLLLVGYRIASGPVERLESSRLGRWLLAALFFHLTCYGWLLFRAESLADIGRLSAALIRWSAPAIWTGAELGTIWLYAACMAVPILALWLDQERRGRMETVLEWPPVARVAFYSSLAIGIVVFGVVKGEAFIYFQF